MTKSASSNWTTAAVSSCHLLHGDGVQTTHLSQLELVELRGVELASRSLIRLGLGLWLGLRLWTLGRVMVVLLWRLLLLLRLVLLQPWLRLWRRSWDKRRRCVLLWTRLEMRR